MSIDLGKKTGAISLRKGERVSITKGGTITATVSWPSSTDYDLYALVLTTEGSEVHVATFGTKDGDTESSPSAFDGAIKHLGDVTRPDASGRADEVMQIWPDPRWVKLALVAYSAQSNGTGSFRRYKVSTTVDNGQGDVVSISADDADDNDLVYSVAVAMITNGPDGLVIEALEQYSAARSEKRPSFDYRGRLRMDRGATNVFK